MSAEILRNLEISNQIEDILDRNNKNVSYFSKYLNMNSDTMQEFKCEMKARKN